MKKRIILSIVLIMSVITLFGCSSFETEIPTAAPPSLSGMETEGYDEQKTDGVSRIGICQFTMDENVTEIYSGIIKGLEEAGYKDGENVVIEYDIAETENDCMYAADRMVSNECDIIIAISLQAAKAVKNRTQDIPVIVAGVDDLYKSGFVSDNNEPGGNISGVSSVINEEVQSELIKKLFPDAKNVAFLYSNNVNSRYLMDEFEAGCVNNGLKVTYAYVSDSGEVRSVLQSLVGKVDAVYCPDDEIVFSNMADAAGVCNDNKIPFFCNSSEMVTYGSLASYTADYGNIGRKAAEMAVSVLKDGKSVSTMPVQFLSSEECYLNINSTTAEIIGFKIPAGYR